MTYNYYELTLGEDRGAQKGLAAQVRQTLGDHAVALFSPLLGYATNQALLLTDEHAPVDVLLKAAGVVSVQRRLLAPTLRPAPGARPIPGGVYVHRWFTIDASGFDEFVTLSGKAWVGFERDFDTQVFGLLSAEVTPEDRKQGQRRMLLMTRYRDLGEWEKSRNSTGDTAAAFARRQELTRVALPRACLLVPTS